MLHDPEIAALIGVLAGAMMGVVSFLWQLSGRMARLEALLKGFCRELALLQRQLPINHGSGGDG